MKKITVKEKGRKKIFKDNWRRCVGTGHMGLALQQEYQDCLTVTQDEIGFDYIRGHGILSDLVGVYRSESIFSKDDISSSPNFTYVDRIYDSLLDNGIRPLVELSFMPEQMSAGEQTVFYWKGNICPPKSYSAWRKLITEFVRHLIKRYGKEEVRSWPFEVWNEPDCENTFWAGDQEDYFELYRQTVKAVRKADGELIVGGPATCPGGIAWITPFLDMCKKKNVPVDFAATHSYYGKGVDRKGEFSYQDLSPMQSAIDQFKEARDRVRNSPFPDIPLYMTEFNTSYIPQCMVHDSALNAAFLGRLLSEGGDYADMFSYWTFCDVFEELDIPRAQFHGGFGLMAQHCVRKPTYHLYEFFGHLGTELLYRDDNMIVTCREDGSVVLVAWNPVTGKSARKFRAALRVPFKAPAAFVKTQTVDETVGSALAAWVKMGRPRYPSDEQTEVLHHASMPSLDVDRAKTARGHITLDIDLKRNGISLIEASALEDETPSYIGLDHKRTFTA